MKKHQVAVVGLGGRGASWAEHIMLRPDCDLVALCDEYPDRVEASKQSAERKGLDTVRYAVTDYKELLDKKEIEMVLIITAWESHVDLAVDFMNAGIITALEVGGAYALDDCYRLIEAYEKTKTPFFFMENCCYGKRELMVLNMARQGVLGEIVHCTGSYGHDLRSEIANGTENRHYRKRNYKVRNCENYPTHDLGPIARVLNINHGNRLVTLTSTASKAAGLARYIADNKPEETDREFKQGDIITTVIKCAGGETIVLTLDTTLPRTYSRGFQVRGTKGMYLEDNDMVFLDDEHYPKYEFNGKPLWGNASEYEEKYLDDIWRQDIDTSWGHDGMDALMFNDFIRCVEAGLPMPVDVYDAATWMSISCLSEASIQKGGAPMEIPDFTRGKWILPE